MIVAQLIEAPLFDHGGVEVLARELISELYKREIHTLLVSPRDLNQQQKATLPGVKDVFVWSCSAPQKEESMRLVRWLRDHATDIAHFHLGGTYGWRSRSWSGCPIPLIARSGIPCVSTNHGAFSIFDCVGPNRPLSLKMLSLPFFWFCKLHQLDYVHWEATVSMHDFLAVRKWFFPMRKKFLQLYHSKLRGNEFSFTPAISDRRVPKNPFILCLGTIGSRKGQQYLVEAFLQVALHYPEWRLVLAGRQAHEPTMKRIEELINSSMIEEKVILMPDVDDEMAGLLFQKAEIFAIPSTGEGLGLSLQEAMYAGCACIGSRVGGIPDLIKDGKTGLLVSPADPKALAKGLERLIGDAVLRHELAAAGKRSMAERNMTARNMTESYVRLYRDVLKPGAHAHVAD
jgi:glycosyltransferase involved in cell wall biosynthesis